MGTSNNVQLGLAFGRIRDFQLYRWNVRASRSTAVRNGSPGGDYVDQLISAAQVFTQLLTNCQRNYSVNQLGSGDFSPQRGPAAGKEYMGTAFRCCAYVRRLVGGQCGGLKSALLRENSK